MAFQARHGTLVLPKSGNKFVQNPTDQILMVGAVEGCQRLIDAGYVLAIASNQGGIAAGFKTLEEAATEMRYCLHLLKGFNIDIKVAMFCPDFEGNRCIAVWIDREENEIVEKGGESVDNLEPKIPVAIAVNQKYNELLSSHPDIKKKAFDLTNLFAAMSTKLKIIVLDKMDDGCLLLYSQEDVDLAVEVHESYDYQKIDISFIAWLNMAKRSKIAMQEASPWII
jgi:hypothetical protein